MSCQNQPIPSSPVSDWNGFQTTPPCNPLKLIAYIQLERESVVKVGALNFDEKVLGVSTWNNEEPILRKTSPVCVANDTTDGNLVANAAQWNFLHMTTPAAGIVLALQETVFMRSGPLWKMCFSLDFRDHAFRVIGCTFLKNLATRGDAQGTVPMISFENVDSGFSGIWNLEVTLKTPGSHALVFVGWTDYSGDPAVAWQFPMTWEVVS